MSSLPPTNVDPEWGLEGWKTASLLKKKRHVHLFSESMSVAKLIIETRITAI